MKIGHEVYKRAYSRLLERYKATPEMNARESMKKLLFLGLKKVVTKPDRKSFTKEEAEFDFQEIELTMACMRLLTPIEFMQLFQIDKEYKGHKWQMKDYFYTKDYVQKLPQNEPIREKLHHFLWEYSNLSISLFMVRLMGAMSNLRKLEGLPSLAEEWADKNNIKTYTLHEGEKGKQFLFDKSTGKTIRVKKPKPRYIKKIK